MQSRSESDGSDVFISADEDFSESELGPSLENSLVAGSDYDIATSCDEANRDSAIAKEVDPIFFPRPNTHSPFQVFCALLLLCGVQAAAAATPKLPHAAGHSQK
jgi:hypothetical protein